jgi:chromosome segregation ATPase
VDHFAKVRRLIKDLVTRLENEAKEEQTQKDFCDKEIEKAVAARDAASSDKEAFSQELAAKEAKSNELKAEIAQLAGQIAANKKALLEATELRGEEQAENEKTVADSKAGKEAVLQAIEVLKNFYDNAGSLLQKRSAYTPPNSDRSGATVADLAPKVFDENYAGDQDGAKGILGMLEVIRDDFERTEIQTGNEESEAKEDFDNFKSELDLDTRGKKGEIETSKSTVADLKERLVELKEDLSAAKSELEASLGELQTLKEACVESAETHEERAERRQQEVEGLKQALDILENFKGL